MAEQRIGLGRMEEAASLFGPFDENIRIIERELQVQVMRGLQLWEQVRLRPEHTHH